MTILAAVQNPDTPAGKIFDLAALTLILTSVVVMSIETLPNLTSNETYVLGLVEIAITIAFTFEYALRVAASTNKRAYIFSFYGLVDLIAILPFYLFFDSGLQILRIVRLFRLFRMLKLARYSRAVQVFGNALARSRDQFVIFFFATSIMLFVASYGIYQFEHEAQPESFQSVFHSMWWAVATLTTVGYGDVYPVTAGGRFFASLVVLFGLATVAAPAGIIASALTEVSRDDAKKL